MTERDTRSTVTEDGEGPAAGPVYLPAIAGGRGLSLPSERARAGQTALARPARFGLRSILFALLVAMPVLVSAIYLFGFATDQFVSESRFGIRSADSLRNDASAVFQGMASASQIGLESNVMVQYAQSREIVDALEAGAGLRKLYSAPGIDWWSRLGSTAGAEDVVAYWRGKVDPFFDLTTGSISLRVKAFARTDAQKLNEEVLRLSENLVNDISSRARNDTVKRTQEEVAKAEERLSRARQAILEFRNKERQIDPKKQADSLLALAARLREDMARANADVSYARSYLSEKAPQVIQGRNRIRSLQEQIDATEQQLTSARSTAGEENLSRTVGSFDTLESERLFAEKLYNASLESLQKAQGAADRQSLYFSVFVRPALPDRSTYPRRLESVFLTLLGGLGAWIMAVIALYSLREHV